MTRISLICFFAVLSIGCARLRDPVDAAEASIGLKRILSEPAVLDKEETTGDIELRDSRRMAKTHFVSHQASGRLPKASELKIEFAGLVTTAKASQARDQVVKTKGGVKGRAAESNAQPQSVADSGEGTNSTDTGGAVNVAVKAKTSKGTAKQGQRL